MKTIKLYLLNWYEAYRADEQGQRWSFVIPNDNIDYKSEVVEEAEFILPAGFEVKDFYGQKCVTKGGVEYQLVTEKDGTASLVGDEIITLQRV